MSDSNSEQLTGFDLWTPNDYSNFITISAAAIGSTLLVIFKSKCKNITLCWGLLGCIREVGDDDTDEENPPALAPAPAADADAIGGIAGNNQPPVNPPAAAREAQAPDPVQNP